MLQSVALNSVAAASVYRNTAARQLSVGPDDVISGEQVEILEGSRGVVAAATGPKAARNVHSSRKVAILSGAQRRGLKLDFDVQFREDGRRRESQGDPKQDGVEP